MLGKFIADFIVSARAVTPAREYTFSLSADDTSPRARERRELLEFSTVFDVASFRVRFAKGEIPVGELLERLVDAVVEIPSFYCETSFR